MRRPSRIALVLMGGGLALSGCDRDCREARAQHRPDADQICQRNGSSSSGSHSGGYYARSGSSSTTTADSSSGTSRGGFGAALAHALGG